MLVIDLLALIVATASVAYAALLVARRLGGASDTVLEHAVTVALLFVVGVVLVSLAVGVVGLYSTVPVTVASLAVALAAWVLLGRGPRPARAGWRERARSLGPLARREPLAAVSVAFAALALAHRALVAVVLPPAGYDALAYHLVFVGDWVRRATIGGSDLQQAGCCGWYPVNAELTYAWLAVFPHSDRFVSAAQVGYLAVGALATAAIARAVGAPDRWAAVAGSLFALTPAALGQANLAYTDVALAAAVLVTAVFMLRLLRADAGAVDVVRFGLAAGFTLGVKGTAVAYVAAACLVAAAGVALRARRGTRPRGSLVRAGAVVALFLVLGSGWYLRSWAQTGNPFWPYRIAVAERVVFEGIWNPIAVNATPEPLEPWPAVLRPARSWVSDLDVPARMSTEPERPDARLGGLGPAWLLLGLPAVAAALVLTLRRRDRRFAAFALAVGLPSLAAVPDPWWSRFTIALAAVGFVALARVLAELPRSAARAVVAIALVLAAVGVLTTRPLGALADLRRTAGAPLERPASSPDGLDYSALDAIPGEARVGVKGGSPLLRYLVLGERFQRDAVPLPNRRRAPAALRRIVERERLAYVVTRTPLPESTVAEAALEPLAATSGVHVYRVAPNRTASGGSR